MIETDEDFSPFPGGYDYLVDFLDLSFPKERPSREHPYEEVSSDAGGSAPPSLPSPVPSLLSFLNKLLILKQLQSYRTVARIVHSFVNILLYCGIFVTTNKIAWKHYDELHSILLFESFAKIGYSTCLLSKLLAGLGLHPSYPISPVASLSPMKPMGSIKGVTSTLTHFRRAPIPSPVAEMLLRAACGFRDTINKGTGGFQQVIELSEPCFFPSIGYIPTLPVLCGSPIT